MTEEFKAQRTEPLIGCVNHDCAKCKKLESQEPVAWVNKERNTIIWDKLYPDMDALYTHPPQRTWVGLTSHERMMCRSFYPDEAVAKTEAKLKEKNNA
jgi:hypothetical protein